MIKQLAKAVGYSCRFFYFRAVLNDITSYINAKLNERIEGHSLRTLNTYVQLVDFCSNDYLGFARSADLQSIFQAEISKHSYSLTGSTGSRLISGNDPFTEDLENYISHFHQAEAALIFNSGYDANVGIFSSLPQRGDTIITDELIHASIIDGARLSFANRYSFKHNDLNSLEEKLKVAKGRIFIAVESIYSMDGDTAPLQKIAALAERYSAALIVDEAHAVGIFGEQGQGLVHQLGLQDQVFARIITFGKALGCHGAAILGSQALRSYLINFARSFIYTTAASPLSHLSVYSAYQYLRRNNFKRDIELKIAAFKEAAGQLPGLFINSESPIQCLLVEGNQKAKRLEAALQDAGFAVRAILHPTVAEGKERLRFCLHTFNSDNEIKLLLKKVAETFKD
ncbi:aminotransferase class I/II-fold pyridoxal phosphate-dependent enzyme [Desertivirga xinjiangensis]|uniref:aminotransferase class I/II-fold pyridoxal phosphate-dependent enzyme n=1 Tax=Desertivirga xinjiangensis TaxID=539206 RepID=UPI00210C2603|nr:8-amino-7-oxononanoate synthase [Pedobacter xinjiangensis]